MSAQMKLQPFVIILPAFCRKLDGCIKRAIFVMSSMLEDDVNCYNYHETEV